MSPKELLQSLHDAVGKGLLDKIQSGEATAADYGAAIKFLKDNGIEADPVANETVSTLARNIPVFGENVIDMEAHR